MATTKKDMTKAELEAKIAELEALLRTQKAEATQTVEVPTVQAVTPNITVSIPSTDVTVVYCSDSLGFAKISNMELNFTRYGEEFLLTRSQFDELVGKYRRWFDSGILAVSYKNVEIAAAKGLRTDSEINVDSKILESLGSMSAAKLEELWENTPLRSTKQSIVSYYKRKFIEGDERYKDREKIDLLNRLTEGGFHREQDEMSGRFKIYPTEM